MGLGVYVLTVCLLVWPGVARECSWDRSTDPNQSLHPRSLDAGAVHLGEERDVLDPASCRAACCAEPACDLAVVGFPMDGTPQCSLVSCGKHRDACELQPSTQFKVYRKNQESETLRKAPEDGEKLHVVPLMETGEPRSNDSNNVRCRLPMRVGLCRAAFPKFFYDVTNQTCRQFVYGGCGANGNNFDSRESCEAACSGVQGSVLPDESTPAPPGAPVKSPRMAPAYSPELSQDSAAAATAESKPAETEHAEKKEMQADEFTKLCGVDPDVGPCRAAFQRWYYNGKTGGCQTFTYGGCKGNKNNYDTQDHCMSSCSAVSVLPSKKASSNEQPANEQPANTDYEAYCLAPPDSGPCRAAFQAFHYDPAAARCHPFIYGGCRGNNNRYGSAEECMARCGEGSPEGRGQARSRWTAAFFLFVTLAAISALLLTTLVVITLRRHGLTRRPSSVSDKEELLPDPDEQSSVESLTVPDSPKPEKA